MASDEALMTAIAAGDARAFDALYARWEAPLQRFVARATGGHDVDDCCQETWLRVVRGADGFDPSRRFSTWLFRIALNCCHDRGRRTRPVAVDPGALDDIGGPDTTARAAAALDADRLLAALPPAQREALVLRLFHDMPEAELARILDVPRGTVKSRLHHAMRTLVAAVRRAR